MYVTHLKYSWEDESTSAASVELMEKSWLKEQSGKGTQAREGGVQANAHNLIQKSPRTLGAASDEGSHVHRTEREGPELVKVENSPRRKRGG